MTPEQFIAEALDTNLDASIASVLDACEVYYMNGTPDDLSGDVEAPTGHFYRCARWIVRTDSQGFKELLTFDTEFEATGEFQKMVKAYIEWAGEDD